MAYEVTAGGRIWYLVDHETRTAGSRKPPRASQENRLILKAAPGPCRRVRQGPGSRYSYGVDLYGEGGCGVLDVLVVAAQLQVVEGNRADRWPLTGSGISLAHNPKPDFAS